MHWYQITRDSDQIYRNIKLHETRIKYTAVEIKDVIKFPI